MEMKLLSYNSIIMDCKEDAEARKPEPSVIDGSIFDLKYGSMANLLSKLQTVTSPKSMLTFNTITDVQQCESKISKEKSTITRQQRIRKLIVRTPQIDTRIPLKNQTNMANNRFKLSTKQSSLATMQNDIKRYVNSLASLDKVNGAKFPAKSKFLTLGRSKTTRNKRNVNKPIVKRHSNVRLFTAKAQELVRLLSKIEKLEGRNLSTEKDLIDKCACMVIEKSK